LIASRFLLLEFGQVEGLCGQLGQILEPAFQPVPLLRREQVGAGGAGPRTDVGRLVSGFGPAIVFLVLGLARQAEEVLRALRSGSGTPIIVVGGTGEPTEVLELLRLGATDFVTPPLTRVDLLPRVFRSLPAQGGAPTAELEATLRRAGLVGRSPAFLREVAKIPLVSDCDASVLITGETGTGKELFARAIHELGPRAGRAFIPVNCGAIPVELVENELFGHEKGAFTSAAEASAGLIREADGGTLFLDEIDSLPLMAQVKLLRFLQDREYRPLGSRKTFHADVRVITASNIDFERAVETGELRRDLYYRLNIIPFTLPPLRERRDDIPTLATHFVAKYATRFRKGLIGFSPDATQCLMRHTWPGNVRELEHVVERAVALSTQPLLRPCDLTVSADEPSAPESFKQVKAKVVSQFERTYLQGLLLAHQGNVTLAAAAARKNRRAFWQLLRKHRIDAGTFRDAGPRRTTGRADQDKSVLMARPGWPAS
jgi:two-component system, NtrC family, response regulator GlrR